MKKHLFSVAAMMMAASGAMAVNPYVAKVYEFCPAPGQFIHDVPILTDDMTPEEVIAEVESQLCGNDDDGAAPGMVSLGAFGGYVVFGFDHPLVNVKGEYDLRIFGNSFRGMIDDEAYGSSEPGIVMVSVDTNGNGIPDDEWFELAGSEYHSEGTFHNFEITYKRPADNTTGVSWTSNDPAAGEGSVERTQFHTQNFWPGWYAGETLTFRGTRLAPNAQNTAEEGENWVLHAYDWGYADNLPNDEDPGLKLDWAVDAQGNPVELEQVHFIKVYTALAQNCGWIGETSTEVCGAQDLHPEALAGIETIASSHPDDAPEVFFDLRSIRVDRPTAPGIYLRSQGGKVTKIIVR
ncbi:MAG: PKD domain-containing protein [Bacteroidales bacterium]|nr:PKD domain-containing protein [Bacteroidales bacterium]